MPVGYVDRKRLHDGAELGIVRIDGRYSIRIDTGRSIQYYPRNSTICTEIEIRDLFGRINSERDFRNLIEVRPQPQE